jgi:hypothetical protein
MRVGSRRPRFVGAGASAERRFAHERRQNVRDAWKAWFLIVVGVLGFFAWSLSVDGYAARVLALAAGALLGCGFVVWSLGGHISAFRWWLGAEGERETAREIERLGPEWHCEHDLEHEHGNWDHVLVGPPGVFLLDSKLLHGTAAAGDDKLSAGRLAFPGRSFRFGAVTIKERLERQLESRGLWVQAVVVVWGDFPQRAHEEGNVAYVRGDELGSWLESLPPSVNAPRRAALVTALREVRALLSPLPESA